MARYLLIKDGVIENSIEANEDYPVPDGYDFIQSDAGGPGDKWPLVSPPAPNPNIAILLRILVLETSITDRRIREAILGSDNGWLANINSQIAALRTQLT